MNKRIKQLAEQAEIYAGELIDEGADYNQYPRYYTEKFAELIIAECAQACMNEGASYEEKAAGAYQSNLYVTAIKKHFGVKE
jgi:hypothetical protein